MKKLYAQFVSGNVTFFNLETISGQLDHFEKEPIDNLLWNAVGERPTVSFIAAYTCNSLLLKFIVKEKHSRAVYREINDPVYKDSCVEAFIALDDVSYYNLEFNRLGTPLVGFGTEKEGRINISKRLIERISSHSSFFQLKSTALTDWELTVNIPFEVFEFHKITSLAGQSCKANFYKCGDELPEPHYLSWNKISFPEPNFHLPRFFGEVKFVA